MGLWNDEQRDALKRIVDAVHRQGAKIAIQIGHAGSKSVAGGEVVAPSPIRFEEKPAADKGASEYQIPRELTTQEVEEMVGLFQAAVKRAVEAGFDAIELHGAHGI